VSVLVLTVQMFQLCSESVRLVEKVDDNIEAGQYTHGVSDELARRGVVASHTSQQRTRLGNLSEHAASAAAAAAQHSTHATLNT